MKKVSSQFHFASLKYLYILFKYFTKLDTYVFCSKAVWHNFVPYVSFLLEWRPMPSLSLNQSHQINWGNFQPTSKWIFFSRKLYHFESFLIEWPVLGYINTLSPRQNGRRFPDAIFKCIFFNENVWIPIRISLKFGLEGPINTIPDNGLAPTRRQAIIW